MHGEKDLWNGILSYLVTIVQTELGTNTTIAHFIVQKPRWLKIKGKDKHDPNV